MPTTPTFSGVAGAGTGSPIPVGNPNATLQTPGTMGSPVQSQSGLTFQNLDQANAYLQARNGQVFPQSGQTSQPPKEQTVMSSDKSQSIAQNQQKMQGFASQAQNAGYTVDQQGFATFGNSGAYVTAPSTATSQTDANGNTWWMDASGIRYAIGPNQVKDPIAQQQLDQWNQLKTQFDSSMQANIDTITQQYSNLLKQQQQINEGQQASINQSLLVSGTSRYAPENAAGIATSVMNQGQQALAQLSNAQSQAIIQAQVAWQSGDMQLLDKTNQIIDQIQTQVQKTALDLSTRLTAIADQQRVQQGTSAEDLAIANSFASLGPTASVTDIMKSLNGQINPATGQPMNLTAAQVSQTLTAIATNTGAGSLDKLSGDTKDFYLLQKGGLLPSGITDLGSFIRYINSAKQTPAQQATTQLNLAQKSLAIQRTTQLIESAKALEATRLVGSQAIHDKGVQNYLAIAPQMARIQAAQEDIKANGINQSNAADLLDAVTQVNTGGKVITEGQISLTKDSQSYADQITALIQKAKGQGGVIDPKIANDAIRLSTSIFDLYQNQYKQHVSIYNNRLKNVNGQDLTAYSPITDITNLPSVADGSYESSLSTDAQAAQQQVDAINAQALLDNPPSDITGSQSSSYDPSMWGNAQ